MSIEADLREYYDREANAGARAGMGSRGRRDELRGDFVTLLNRERRSSLVEVGAGPGGDAVAFRDASIRYAGFDLGVENARVGRVAGLDIVPGSLYHPPFRSESFDAGWTMSTLLHVPDERFDEAMRAITALLRPGAPLALGLWGGEDREFVNDDDHFDPPRFFSHRSDDRIQSMLSEHGVVEQFESWPADRSDWVYQFIVLRT